MNENLMEKLKGLHVAVPESRQLGVLQSLFEKRGAKVFACPLVSIHDNPNIDEVEVWLKGFIESTPQYLIILTGEGINRLSGFAEKADLLEEWKQALTRTFKLARGPKPNRALKPLGVQADALAEAPTTDGIIESLDKLDLNADNIAVQLYGQNPNDKLQNYLKSKGYQYNTVSPYIYASDSETDKVVELIHKMADKSIDMICFTSQPQLTRLQSVARKNKIEDVLETALANVTIAAVGPVVADQIKEAGYTVSFMPDDQFFMKPMVSAIK